MLFLAKLFLTNLIIIACTQIGRKFPTLGGLIVTMPLIGYVSADHNGNGDVANTPNYLSVRFKKLLVGSPSQLASLWQHNGENEMNRLSIIAVTRNSVNAPAIASTGLPAAGQMYQLRLYSVSGDTASISAPHVMILKTVRPL